MPPSSRLAETATGIAEASVPHLPERPGSPPISPTAARLNTLGKSQHTKANGPLSFTTAPRSGLPKPRSAARRRDDLGSQSGSARDDKPERNRRDHVDPEDLRQDTRSQPRSPPSAADRATRSDPAVPGFSADLPGRGSRSPTPDLLITPRPARARPAPPARQTLSRNGCGRWAQPTRRRGGRPASTPLSAVL
jgi:hypothetical protein